MISDFLVGDRDSIRLDSFRVASGLAFTAYMLVWWLDGALEWLTDYGFHVSRAAAYPMFLPPPPLPTWALAPFGAAHFGLLLAFIVGYRLRWTTPALLLAVFYVIQVDPLASFTPNFLFFAALAMLSLVPGGGYWSVGRAGATCVSNWPIRILQATVLIQYFTNGTCKALFGTWLSNPLMLQADANGPYRTAFAAWLLRHLPVEAWAAMQGLSLAFELAAPLLFASRKLRPLGFAWGAAMHIGIGLLMDEFFWFGLQMIAFYTLFMEDSTLHAARRWLGSWGRRRWAEAPSPAPSA